MTDAPRCFVCSVGAIDSPATHRNDLGEPECDFRHALPGDLPLAGAVERVRREQWPGHTEPQETGD